MDGWMDGCLHITREFLQKGCRPLAKHTLPYLIPEVWVSAVLQEELHQRCVSYLWNWMESTAVELQDKQDT